MRSASLVFAIVLVGGLAGCLGDGLDAGGHGGPGIPAVPRLAIGDAYSQGTDALLWQGRILAEGDEERVDVSFLAPSDYWETNDGALEVSILWELYSDLALELAVYDAQGNLLATGKRGMGVVGMPSANFMIAPGSASVVLLDEAPTGPYTVRVKATQGSGAYEGVVQLEAAPPETGPVRELLPNLVTLAPIDLAIRDPDGAGAVMEAAGVKGCRADETAEEGVKRCLRFSNAIANVGEGRLEMRLEPREGVESFAGEGTFVQRIWRSDGSYEDRPVGQAEFHPHHGHYHYAGTALFELYAYDLAGGTRGVAVAESRKTGFCLADLALADLGLPHTALPQFDARGCFDPVQHGVWTTGLMPNWYDRYHWSWFEQYVELDGVGDGVYELVSTANVEKTLHETSPDDNESSVVFRLTGDDVEVLTKPEPAAQR